MKRKDRMRKGTDEDPSGISRGIPPEEDILESHDDYDALKARKRELPRGYILGNWHKLRLRMIVAIPMILLMLFAMLFTSLIAIVLAKYEVMFDQLILWDWLLPLAGAVACAAGLIVMFRWWPTEERVGPLRMLGYGVVTCLGLLAAAYGVIGLIGIMTGNVGT